MTKEFNRRDFLKYLSFASAAAVLPQGDQLAVNTKQGRLLDGLDLGRVCFWRTLLYKEANVRSPVSGYLKYDDIIRLPEITMNEDAFGKPKPWYKLGDEQFLEAGWVQRVKFQRNRAEANIPEGGRLGEMTVPMSDVYLQPGSGKTLRRYYYSATFWVVEMREDGLGQPWYALRDDVNGSKYWVPAYTIRMVTPDELTPLSPELDLEEKHIELDLTNQIVRAFERNEQVFEAVVSTGLLRGSTPLGYYETSRKRPTRRMVNEPHLENHYDLPGVPWVSYFTDDGVAFHGAYWHANWGNRMSNGCINMLAEEAKWIYRWCDPRVPFDQFYYEEPRGTRVDVFGSA